MRRHSKIVLAAALALAASAPAAQAQRYSGIYVAAPGDIWLVGENGGLVHGRAGSWVKAPDGSPLPNLNAVTGFGPDNVFIVGDEGTILRWDGTTLTRPNAGTSANLVAVFGCAPNDVWAIGTSEDMGEPAIAVHFDGGAWHVQRMPLAFRPTAIAGSCPDLVVSGISYFDPRPDQRRDVGVVARLRGGQWATSGWDGRRMTDEQLGGTAWLGAAGTGGVAVIWGQNKALISRGGGAWTPLGGVPAAVAMVVTMDGSMAAIHPGGFSRWVSGSQWRTVGQGALETAAGNALGATAQQVSAAQNNATGRDTAAIRRINERMEAISRAMPANGQPTSAQLTEMMQLSQQLMAANGGSMLPPGMNMQQMQQMQAQGQAAADEAQRNRSAMSRNMTLRFGERPVAVGGRGADFYVAGEGGVMHVTGDVSKLVFTQTCLYPQQGAPASMYADCRADGGTGGPPPALNVPPPMPRVEGPGINAPSRGNPLPSIRKPRIRIP